jgi:exodeoxyribonuclease-3
MTITIISWNVNGLRAAYQKGFMPWFRRAQPDILCLQETKAHPGQLPPDLREVSDYHVHYAAGERKGYSGTALFSRTRALEVTQGMGVPEFDGEGRLLIARYPDFTLANCYFPNGKASAERLRYKLAFYEAFQKHLAARHKRGERFIVTGDVNTAHQPMDLAHPKANEKTSGFLPEERAWMDRFLAAGYVDVFRHLHPDTVAYTWWDLRTGARARDVGWRLDYFLVDRELMPRVISTSILKDVMGSDHCPVALELEADF